MRLQEKQVRYLKDCLEELMETRSVNVDNDLNEELEAVMKDQNNNILQQFPDGSFAQLFWQQQEIALSKKDRRGMRWDPLMVKWCLYLHHKSSSAYELLRESGCIVLPSQRTLRDYTHYVKATEGFSIEVDVQLGHAAKIESCEEYEKYVIMLMDEMYIKEDLVYDGSLRGQG